MRCDAAFGSRRRRAPLLRTNLRDAWGQRNSGGRAAFRPGSRSTVTNPTMQLRRHSRDDPASPSGPRGCLGTACAYAAADFPFPRRCGVSPTSARARGARGACGTASRADRAGSRAGCRGSATSTSPSSSRRAAPTRRGSRCGGSYLRPRAARDGVRAQVEHARGAERSVAILWRRAPVRDGAWTSGRTGAWPQAPAPAAKCLRKAGALRARNARVRRPRIRAALRGTLMAAATPATASGTGQLLG
jgi:hypothetical protein